VIEMGPGSPCRSKIKGAPLSATDRTSRSPAAAVSGPATSQETTEARSER